MAILKAAAEAFGRSASQRVFKQIALGLLISSHAAANPVLTPRGMPTFDWSTSEAGNPFVDGWYADPDAEIYNDLFWVYPTYSDEYEKQTFFDAFSSPDLVHWTKHPNILTADNVEWAHKAMWAPSTVKTTDKSGADKYYLYFGANDIQPGEAGQGAVGGIGVAVADRPEGPYKDALGKPLIGEYHNGAQPIDQDVFVDDDGEVYMYYGGHGHLNMVRLNEDMISLGTFADNTTFKEITPENYVEGPQVFRRGTGYYLMWSEGGWTGPDYSVAYAMSDNPQGPWETQGKILQQDDAVARGSGHNGVIHEPTGDFFYIVYHRRPLSETDGNHRQLAYDRMYFNDDWTIQDIKMLVKDNFADNNMVGWKTGGSGEWTVKDQKLHGTSENRPALAMLDTNFTDVTFDASVTMLNSSDSAASLIFRASDLEARDYYYAKLSNDMAEIGMSQHGEESVLAMNGGSFMPGVEYHVRVLAFGSEIKMFVKDMDQPLVTAEDDVLARGPNGVAVVGSAKFDDISVGRPE